MGPGVILHFLATNEVIIATASICGIAGFLLAIIVSIRTARIGRILKYNQTATQYNKERKSYQNVFEGHRASIFEDGLRSDKLLNDILRNVEAYQSEFHEILSFREKITLFMLKHSLKKKSDSTNYNAIANHLATLSGRLSKKEEQRNG